MINSSLTSISNPIKQELEEFNLLYKKSLKSKVALVDLVAKYILRQKGKKIRPLLVMLSSKISGGISDKSYRGAILVELLHSATLIHDDVVDSAAKRRGFASINAVWKNKVAVLMGDYLLAKGLMIAVDNKDYDILGIVTETVKRMSEGELLQISKTRKLDTNEETYFKIISDKTASLLSTCCEIGAVSSTDNPEYQKAMRNFGENLGIAFQIRDDILDVVGKTNIIGKPLGGDIKEKKLTLPLIYSLENSSKSESTAILKKIKASNKNGQIKEIIDFMRAKGGIEYSIDIANKYSEKARSDLSIFPDSEEKESLLSLIDFVINRIN